VSQEITLEEEISDHVGGRNLLATVTTAELRPTMTWESQAQGLADPLGFKDRNFKTTKLQTSLTSTEFRNKNNLHLA